jgi:hypothetical protein
MNLKSTLYLFGGLVILLLGFAALQLFKVLTPEERKERERYLVPAFHDKFNPVEQGHFTRVVVERKGDKGQEKLEFQKTGNDWTMIAPKQVRTNTGAVSQLINQIMNAERAKYADVKGDLAKFGLDAPKTVVRLYRGDAETTVNFGEEDAGKDPVVYATISDDAKHPAAVKKSSVDKVFASLNDFRDKRLFGSSFDVTGLRLAPVGKKPLEFEKAERDWKFKEPKLGDADSNGVEEITRNVTGLSVEKNSDFIADGPFDEAALAKYGLSKDKASAITVRRKDPNDPKKSVEETLLVETKDPAIVDQAHRVRVALLATESLGSLGSAAALAVREKEDQESGALHAKLATDNTIVRIDAKHLKLFDKKADELRSRHLAKIEVEKTDAINLTTGGETLRFRRPELKVALPVTFSPRPFGGEGSGVRGATGLGWNNVPHSLNLQFERPGGAGGMPFGPPPRTPATPAPAPADWDLYTDSRAKVKTHLDTIPRLIDALNKIELKDTKAFLDETLKQREWFGKDEKGNDVPIDLGLDKPQAEIWIWQEGIKRTKEGKPEGEGEPKLKDEIKAKPNIKIVVGRKDEKRGVVYVRRQVDDGDATILAVPDPWITGAEPPPPTVPGQPPPPPPQREVVSLSEKATGGYYAYRDHTLPSFTLTNATKLTYTRGGVTYEAEKEEKKDDKGATVTSWQLKKPVESKAQDFSVEQLLRFLSELSADKLLTDRATERDLKEKFGLVDKPMLKATVTVNDKDSKKKSGEYTYIIGKKTEAESKHVNHLYVRMEVKPAEGPAPDANQFVFVVPWYVAQSLDTELRDGKVLAEEKTAKPTDASFIWRKLDKDKKLTETKLDLVYKPEKEGSDKKVWSVAALTVNGKDAKADLPKLDVEKVDQLLGTSASARFGGTRLAGYAAPHFVVHNGKPDPKQRLDPASKDAPPALVVEVKYDDKTAKTVVFGDRWEPKEDEHPALAPKPFYYAASSNVPNAVFVLPELEFKQLVEGVEFFKAGEKTAAE